MATYVKQAVKVLAVFGDGRRLRPIRFLWNERTYRVKEITYVWSTFTGSAKVEHFSVSDGVNLYELSYNTESMAWTLEAVEEM